VRGVRLDEELVRRPHALGEREVAVGLEQQIHPIREPAEVAAEPRMVRVGHPAFALPALVLHEVPVEEALETGATAQPFAHGREQLLAHPLDGLGSSALHGVGRVVGHREAMDRSVRRVAVDREVRLPHATHARLEELHLARVLAQVVAVEVDARCVHACADLGRPELACAVRDVEHAVLRIDAIVPVRIEQGNEHDDEILEQSIVLPVEPVAQQHLARFLALDLPGVDPVDHEHDRTPRSARIFRRHHVALRRDCERELAPFRRASEAR
jgi:hypothetical protein